MRLVVVGLLTVMALSGCGGSDDGGGGFRTPPQDDDGRYVITLTQDQQFSPDRAEVPKDARVVFVAELEGCDVRSPQPGGPDSRRSQYGNGLLPDDGEYGWWAPAQAAEFDLVCTLHEEDGMVGVLRVA